MWRRPKCRVLAVKVAQTIPQWLYMARNDCQPHRARRGTIGKIGPNGIIGATRMPSSKMPIFAFHSQHVVQIRSGAKYSDIISLIHIYGFKHREIKPSTSKIWQPIKLVPEKFATSTGEFPEIQYRYRRFPRNFPLFGVVPEMVPENVDTENKYRNRYRKNLITKISAGTSIWKKIVSCHTLIIIPINFKWVCSSAQRIHHNYHVPL